MRTNVLAKDSTVRCQCLDDRRVCIKVPQSIQVHRKSFFIMLRKPPQGGRASQGESAIPRTPKQSLAQAQEVPSVPNINVKMTEHYGTVISFHTDKNRYYT